MPRYSVALNDGPEIEVDADNVQHQGNSAYHFYREHPAAALRRIAAVPANPNWDEGVPYYPPILVAAYVGVNRILLIEE